MDIWFSNFSTNFFVNPALVVPGAALVASPIIIHLINRMRFRRVRFAAMEFLLKSQQQNRRRLLIEQIILLMLRILIVLALLALIARLVLDPSQMALLGGARAHHVVVLDNSGSMQDRWAETNAFQEGLAVIRKLVQEGAAQPDTQEFTLLLLSNSQPIHTREKVNGDFVKRLETTLENLRCTHRSLDLVSGLDEAGKLLAEEKSGIKHLHVISDFRKHDWLRQQALAKSIAALDESGVSVNLVKTTPQRHANLGVTAFTGDLHVAVARVPLRLTVGVKNFDTEQPAENVRLAVFADGEKLPLYFVFEKIEAGVGQFQEMDIDSFESPGPHSLQVMLEPDALSADNARFLAVDVQPANHVLVIDGDPAAEEAFYVETAMSAYSRTGIAPLVETVDYLGKNPLDDFRCIFLLNVPEVPPDAVQPLKDFVAGGGGLAWFLGEAVNPSFYNDKLFGGGDGLFPVPLAVARLDLPHDDETIPGPDLDLSRPHPIFEKLTKGQVNPVIQAVSIYSYLPVADGWNRDDNERRDGVSTVLSLRNKDPLMFEHRYGENEGRVVTCLTSAGPIWNDWARNRSFPAIILDLTKYIARNDRSGNERLVGQPIELSLDPAIYTAEVDVTAPGIAPMRVEAAPEWIPQKVNSGNERNTSAAGGSSRDDSSRGQTRLVAAFRDTEAPGIYSVKLLDQSRGEEERLMAYNVPVDESHLELISTDELRKRIGPDVVVQIQEAGTFDWIQGEEAGREIRESLLLLLVIVLLIEQVLAYVFSYHPKTAGATA